VSCLVVLQAGLAKRVGTEADRQAVSGKGNLAVFTNGSKHINAPALNDSQQACSLVLFYL